MKPISLILLLLALAGCSTQRGEHLFIENLSRQLSENNASFTLNVQPGSLLIHRVNPTVGMSANASPTNASVTSSTNLALQVIYHVATPAPTMPNQQTTNSTPQPKPK